MIARFTTILLVTLVLCAPKPLAAQDSTWSKVDTSILNTIDTTALYDSIMNELRMLGLVDYQRKSMVDFNVGIANGSFALQNKNYEVSTNHVFLNTGIGYYHKSGLSLIGGANFTNDQNRFTMYQAFVAPGYDFQNKSVAAGISYFHYFNKKDLSFYVSPLVNEFYTYFVYKKWWLQPKVAFDYGWGTYDQLAFIKTIDTVRYRRFAPIVRYLSKQDGTSQVDDISAIFTLRHDFVFSAKTNHKVVFRYTPSVTLLAGTSRYGTNTPLNAVNAPRMANITAVKLFKEMYSPAFAPPPAKFEAQNFTITNYGIMHAGKFYVQGQMMFSYIIPKSHSKWNFYYNIGCGINL